MAVNLSPLGGVGAQFFDSNGNPLSGGMIYTYAAGTSTPAATYTSSAGNIQHSNPIVLDAAGRVPTGEIWLTDGVSYKFTIKTSADVLVNTYDNIVGINSNYIAFTMQQEIQTATAGQTVFDLTTMQYQPGTNSLSVFVDGVNQYGPGAQYAYVETDSNTVTFVSGLHDGASVKFTTATPVSSGSTDAQNVSYTPPFSGSIGTTVETKLSEIISVKDFGAVGDGVTDDTAAIQNALDYCAANDAYLTGNVGTYLISDTISVNCSCDLSEMTIETDGTSVSPAIIVGGTTSITYLQNAIVILPKVNNTTRVSGYWGSGVGVELANCDTCLITVTSVTNFEYGVTCGGYSQGFAYNTINLQYVYSNKVNLRLMAADATGWANQNLFLGGRLGFNSGDFTSSGYVGTRNILLANNPLSSYSGPNNNLFLNTSIESDLVEYGLDIEGTFNQFQNCRYEGAGALRVRLFSNNVNGGENQILGGYQASSITYTLAGTYSGGSYNCAQNGRSTALNIDESTRITAGSGSIPHFQGFRAGQNALTKNDSSTDWTYRIYETSSEYKYDTDAYARIKLNNANGQISLGTGTISPNATLFGGNGVLYAYAGTGFYPYPDNTMTLGTTNYRWTTVYATTGTINTSDANQKQNIEELDDAEKRVALTIKKLIKKFKFKDAVDKKSEKARIHVGVIAQNVKAAFDAEGLDATQYGLFCSDILEDGTEQLGIRYEELLAFIIAAL